MPKAPQQPDEYSAAYTCDVAAIADARTDLHAWLGARVHHDELVDDVVVVLSELFANSCAASDSTAGHLLVRACLDGEALVLEVANLSRQRPELVERADVTDPMRGQGRGLVIARALMDMVEVDWHDDWTIMRCRTTTPV